MSETATLQGPSWRIDTWFPDLDPTVRKNLSYYHDEVQKFNRTLNLVSLKTQPFADVIHFADSMLASHLIRKDAPQMTDIYDLGGGSGFPGIVMAILFPEIKVHIIDTDQKKCEFLKHFASNLKLSNVDVMNTSLEKLDGAPIKYCVIRGPSSISKSILLTRKLVPKGGSFYHLKGEAWSAEVGEIPTQLCSVWSPALVGEYKLPIGPMKFAVVKTEKIA